MARCLIRETQPATDLGNFGLQTCKALRNIIAKSPPSLPEEEAKASIIDKVNEFINTRITLAANEIAKNAITKIRDGDVILTYGRFVVCFGSFLGTSCSGASGARRKRCGEAPKQIN